MKKNTVSKNLLQMHSDGRKPFKSSKGEVFCAYSLDDPIRKCPATHRSSETVNCTIEGEIKKFYFCNDGRMRLLENSDYDSRTVEKV